MMSTHFLRKAGLNCLALAIVFTPLANSAQSSEISKQTEPAQAVSNTVVRDSQGGFVAGMIELDRTGHTSLVLSRMAEDGSMIWGFSYDHPYLEPRVDQLTELADGGLLALVRNAKGGYGLVRTAADGTFRWAHELKGNKIQPKALAETADGHLYLTGTGFGNAPFLMKVGPDGKVRWMRSYPGKQACKGMAITENMDGNLVVAGQCEKTGCVSIIEVSPTGRVYMSRCISSELAFAQMTISHTADGSYVVSDQLEPNAAENCRLHLDSEAEVIEALSKGSPVVATSSNGDFAMQFMQVGTEELLMEQKPVSSELLKTLLSGETVLSIPD